MADYEQHAKIMSKPTHADGAPSARGKLLYLAYIKDYHKDRELYIERYCRAINRLYSLVLGAYICNMDLGAVVDRSEREQEERKRDARWASCVVPKPGSGLVARLAQRLRCKLAWWMPRPLRPSAWRRQLKFGWLSHLLVALYLVILALLSAETLYLHKYEINRMRLARVQEMIRVHGPSRLVAISRNIVYRGTSDFNKEETDFKTVINLGAYREILSAHLRELRLVVAYLGASFTEWGLIGPAVYVVATTNGFGMYLLVVWLFQWRRRHDVQSNRDHIDLARERSRENALCEREVLKFLESNRVFASIKAQHKRSSQATGSDASKLLHAKWPTNLPQRQTSRRHKREQNQSSETADMDPCANLLVGLASKRGALASDFLACQLLMQMLTSGALRPRNRCNFWLKVRDILQAVLNVGAFIVATGLLWSVLSVLFSRALPGFDPSATSLVFSFAMNGMAFIYNFTTMIGSNIDQALLVRQVLKIIRESIRVNESEFIRYLDMSRSLTPDHHHHHLKEERKLLSWSQPRLWPRANSIQSSERLLTGFRAPANQQVATSATVIERMNCNFLFALMHYKMFVAQFGPFKSTNRGIFLIYFLMMFVLPVVARTHLSYAEKTTQIHIMALLFSTVYLLPLNLLGVPACFLHARCQSLFPALSSLMAHTARVRQHAAGSRIYNEHAIAMLVKEIWNPKQMLEQFTIQSLGISSSYPNLLKLHFWWGLVLISNLLITQGSDGQAEFYGSFLKDPLGVWCFQVI